NAQTNSLCYQFSDSFTGIGGNPLRLPSWRKDNGKCASISPGCQPCRIGEQILSRAQDLFKGQTTDDSPMWHFVIQFGSPRSSEVLRGDEPLMQPVLSVVVPIFNEEQVIPEMYRRMTSVLEGIGEPYELVLVNDGSRDRSGELLHDLHLRDPHVRVINFARNFGHQIAITAGMDYAQGAAVVVIDSDLQDPPEVIAEMVEKWREGYHVVYGVRTEREGESWFKLTTANLFYRLINSMTSVDIPLDAGDFRLMDRAVIQTLRAMREKRRYMRGLSAWVGFKQTPLPYKREARFAGETKYPLKKMLRFATDGVTNFSLLPLQFATWMGFASAFLALVGLIIAFFGRLIWPDVLFGQATTLVSVLFIGGVQLISLGIIGEYLGRIYEEVKGRPLYIVGNAWGYQQDTPLPPAYPASSPPVPIQQVNGGQRVSG
ncbi:MAG: glycosyltransferase family 2 protein, partial [Ardenticatenaceae bacterium]